MLTQFEPFRKVSKVGLVGNRCKTRIPLLHDILSSDYNGPEEIDLMIHELSHCMYFYLQGSQDRILKDNFGYGRSIGQPQFTIAMAENECMVLTLQHLLESYSEMGPAMPEYSVMARSTRFFNRLNIWKNGEEDWQKWKLVGTRDRMKLNLLRLKNQGIRISQLVDDTLNFIIEHKVTE